MIVSPDSWFRGEALAQPRAPFKERYGTWGADQAACARSSSSQVPDFHQCGLFSSSIIASVWPGPGGEAQAFRCRAARVGKLIGCT